MKRIHDGAIGDLITARVYWNQGDIWAHKRQPGWSDTEYQVRTSPDYGNIFDHHAVEFTYRNGAHCMSMCRQIPGCENNVSESVVGTKGTWDGRPGSYTFDVDDKRSRLRVKEVNPYDQEHIDLISSIRADAPLNELRTVAESTLTAIMGRDSAYTGKEITWEKALSSELDTFPKELAWGPMKEGAVPRPGSYVI